jgi:tetratricopeptide (TPR) repeat protein
MSILRRQFDSAETVVARDPRNINDRWMLADVQMARGELRSATQTLHGIADSTSAHGDAATALEAFAAASWISSAIRNQPAVAAAELAAAEKRFPIEQQPLTKRPYYQLAAAYALAGRTDRAKDLIREADRLYSPGLARWYAETGAVAKGLLAVAEKRPRDAIAALGIKTFCAGSAPRGFVCPAPFLAVAYDRAGEADSARAVLERHLETEVGTPRAMNQGYSLAQSLQRLGELSETKGDKQSAIKYYDRLLDLWKNADAELKPRVDDARKRVARLSDTERK